MNSILFKLKMSFIFVVVLCPYIALNAQSIKSDDNEKFVRIHDNLRETPYPQVEHDLFINPCPLLVPYKEKKSEYLQFQLSMDKNFRGNTILSKPVRWCFFNPHRELEEGIWYWRFRSVDKRGKKMDWSKTYSFTVKDDIPVFVTPQYDTFKKKLPNSYPRLYNFFNDNLENVRANITSHKEYKDLMGRANAGLRADYSKLENPYEKAGEISKSCNFMHQAYMMTGEKKYLDKMLNDARILLAYPAGKEIFNNDFYCGSLMFLFTHVYDAGYYLLTKSERKQIENILEIISEKFHSPYDEGYEENHIFDNHFWQSGYRETLQMALILHDKNKKEEETLEYCYELWTARAPASGFNRDGIWHNGVGYFNTNIKTLCYVPTLFEYYTGFDFFQHPWYKEAGKGMVYTWPPKSLSAGFGDGSQIGTDTGRQRTSFADFLARKTGDKYAAWYAQQLQNFYGDFEQRMYRMVWEQDYNDTVCVLPNSDVKAVWFKDCGEMSVHSDLTGYNNNLMLSFRSSPFGSGSHTLADQNSFNLSFRGEPVYRTTGYYLHFSDPHNLLSYRHTRAHNTILIDGIGQPFTTRAYGNIVRMLGGDNISYCVGDASNAYCGLSEYPMWIENFKNSGVEQSIENGFGNTPLTLYRRHIMMLHPDKVLIYDEMEASKPVSWDWLLHSPVKFDIDEDNMILTTKNNKKNFTAVAQLFCSQNGNFSQTDKFVVPPDMKLNKYKLQLPNQWHLTAKFGKCNKNRILTIIQICADGKTKDEVMREGDILNCGDWVIKAELNPENPVELVVYNKKTKAMLNVGNSKETICIDGKNYNRMNSESSILYDWIDGEWRFQEMADRKALQTSSSVFK